MRRILIDDRVRGLAKSFQDFLEKGLGSNYKSPKTHLGELANNPLLNPQQKQYVQLIISEWDNLIVMEPPFDNTIKKFETLFPADKISTEQFGIDPKSLKFLYKEIVGAMRYDYVQKVSILKLSISLVSRLASIVMLNMLSRMIMARIVFKIMR